MTQLNTPYPSTAYLTGFLRSRGIDAVQADMALALVLRLFTAAGLDSVREAAPGPARSRAQRQRARLSRSVRRLPRHDRPRDPLPARQRLHPGPPHRRARPAARRPALCRARCVRRRGSGRGRWRRPAGLGLWRPGCARQGPPPRHAVPQRPGRCVARCGGRALRVRALRRVAGQQPAQLRPARHRAGRAHHADRRPADRAHAGRGGQAPTHAGAALGALPRLGLRRAAHGASHQGRPPRASRLRSVVAM